MKPEKKEEIGQRIKTIRERLGLSQKEFARILGVCVRTISNIENGRTELSFRVLKSMSEQLKVNFYYLSFSGEEMFTIPVNPGKSSSNISIIEEIEFWKHFEEDSAIFHLILAYFLKLRLLQRQAILDDIHKNDPDFQPRNIYVKKSIQEQNEIIFREFIRYYEASPMFCELVIKRFKEILIENEESLYVGVKRL